MPIIRRPTIRRPFHPSTAVQPSPPRHPPIVDPHEIEGNAVNEMPEEYQSESGRDLNPENLMREESGTGPEGLILSKGLITLDQNLVGRVVQAPVGSRTEILTLRALTDDVNNVYTVTVGQVPNPALPGVVRDGIDLPLYWTGVPLTFASLYALIEWGAGGVQLRAVVDLDREQQIVISGSFVRVTAINNYAAASAVGPAIPNVGAWVSLLPASTKKAPRKTETLVIPGTPLAAGGAAFVNVIPPPFAHSLKVYRKPFLTTSMDIIMGDNGGVASGDVSVAAGSDCPEIIIPGNTGSITIFNSTAAVAIDAMTAVFLLDL